MNRIFDRKIILEDGTEFYGYGFGTKRDALVELVFNTSMVGYQEILSDPSYTAQAVVMTYPLIGNYGMCNEDYETDRPTISGLVVREFNSEPSNFRAARTLEDVMIQYDIVGIAGVDTRRLARHIRDEGTCKALIVDAQTPSIACLAKMRSTALPTNQVSVVSTKSPWISACANPKHRVVAVDCGIKHNIIRSLNARGCEVTIVPWTVTVETVVLLSHKKADSYIHIDVEFGEGEGKIPVDSIAKRAEAYKPKEKVTYKMIKEYIEAKYGFKVHTAYIAEVKRNLGLPMYDAPNAVEELKQPRKHPTPEKVEAIKDALRYFAVI